VIQKWSSHIAQAHALWAICHRCFFNWHCKASHDYFSATLIIRAVPILPANFFENRRLKAKSKILEKYEKIWKNGCQRTLTWPILHCKDGDTLLE